MDVPAKTSRPSAGQRALAEKIVSGDRPERHGVQELDASVYIDPLRFEREQRKIFAMHDGGNGVQRGKLSRHRVAMCRQRITKRLTVPGFHRDDGNDVNHPAVPPSGAACGCG